MVDLRKTTASYGIDVTDAQFLRLTRWDDQHIGVVREHLEKVEGVRMLEMNGHFGASIFIEIDAEDDTPETHAKIIDVTKEMIAKTRNIKTLRPRHG